VKLGVSEQGQAEVHQDFRTAPIIHFLFPLIEIGAPRAFLAAIANGINSFSEIHRHCMPFQRGREYTLRKKNLFFLTKIERVGRVTLNLSETSECVSYRFNVFGRKMVQIFKK
jgi:hypothetical protein